MFWDSSAVVPLLLPDVRSAEIATLLRSDAEPALWWVSPVECQSALYRRHREGALPPAALAQALERLKALMADVDVVAPAPPLRERAGRLLAGHPLRAADALQLAAALVWCNESPQGDAFVCLDERLAEAARREGFTVLPD
jgi:hypothetical protein